VAGKRGAGPASFGAWRTWKPSTAWARHRWGGFSKHLGNLLSGSPAKPRPPSVQNEPCWERCCWQSRQSQIPPRRAKHPRLQAEHHVELHGTRQRGSRGRRHPGPRAVTPGWAGLQQAELQEPPGCLLRGGSRNKSSLHPAPRHISVSKSKARVGGGTAWSSAWQKVSPVQEEARVEAAREPWEVAAKGSGGDAGGSGFGAGSREAPP